MKVKLSNDHYICVSACLTHSSSIYRCNESASPCLPQPRLRPPLQQLAGACGLSQSLAASCSLLRQTTRLQPLAASCSLLQRPALRPAPAAPQPPPHLRQRPLLPHLRQALRPARELLSIIGCPHQIAPGRTARGLPRSRRQVTPAPFWQMLRS